MAKFTIRMVETDLVLNDVIKEVEDPSCGAVATFSGPTRNSAMGKAVTHLEYECYAPMAEKQIREICERAVAKWTAIHAIAVEHKMGKCVVGSSGVNIAVSSPHRRDALEGCHYVIDKIKENVAIWKKEFYVDGSVWKENEEWRQSLKEKKGCGCRHADV